MKTLTVGYITCACLVILSYNTAHAQTRQTEGDRIQLLEANRWIAKIETLIKQGRPIDALRELNLYSQALPNIRKDTLYARAYLLNGDEEQAIVSFRRNFALLGTQLSSQEFNTKYEGPGIFTGVDSTPRLCLQFAMLLFRRGEREAAKTIYYEVVRKMEKDSSSKEIIPFEYHFEKGTKGQYLEPTIENFSGACHLWLALYDSVELGVSGHLKRALAYRLNWSVPSIYLAVEKWSGMVPKDEVRSLLAIAETTDEKKLLEWLLAAEYNSGEWNLLEWDHTVGYKRRSENPAFLSGIKRMRSVWQKIAGRWKD